MKPIPLLVLAAVVGWLLYQTWQPTLHDPQAVSRPVTARGDLAGDEQNTIDIFRSAAPSVVYITSIAVRRNLFSLNVYEIPQGTARVLSGTGRGGSSPISTSSPTPAGSR